MPLHLRVAILSLTLLLGTSDAWAQTPDQANASGPTSAAAPATIDEGPTVAAPPPASPSAPAMADPAAASTEVQVSAPAVDATAATPAESDMPPMGPTEAAAREAAQAPCYAWNPVDEEMIDQTRRTLHQTLCGASLWMDGLFGDQRNVEAARGAHGRLQTSVSYSEFRGFQQRVRLDVRVNLPNLEKRASAFFGRDDEDQFVRDRSESLSLRTPFPSIDDHDAWLAGLGYALPGNERFGTDFRVGVRSVRHPRLFAQSRVRYNLYSDLKNLVHLRLTPFWNTRDGFGITPGADYTRVLTPSRLMRWSNIGTVSEVSQGFDWRSSLIFYQGLGKRGIALESFVRGATRDSVPLREFGERLIYRQPLAHDRLFVETVVGYSWPKEDPDAVREGSYLVGLNIELPFGKEDR